MFDTHAHLDESSLNQDRSVIIERAKSVGLAGVLTIGTTLESSRNSIELARASEGFLKAAVGIHPNYTQHAAPDDWEEIVQLATEDQVIGIGETGIDLYWKEAPLELQQDYFHRHIQLSRKTGKPFIVHCRDAEQEVVEQLQQEAQQGPLNGIMHSFCGSQQTLEQVLELGLWISFSGMLTFKANQHLRDLAKTIPADRIMIETDSPYLAPVPYRGKRNEPAYVIQVAQTLADLWDVKLDEALETLKANTQKCFHWA